MGPLEWASVHEGQGGRGLICSGTRPGSIFHLVTAMTNTFPASVFLSFQSRPEGSRGQTMPCVYSYSAKHTFQEKVVGQGVEQPRDSEVFLILRLETVRLATSELPLS